MLCQAHAPTGFRFPGPPQTLIVVGHRRYSIEDGEVGFLDHVIGDGADNGQRIKRRTGVDDGQRSDGIDDGHAAGANLAEHGEATILRVQASATPRVVRQVDKPL